MENEPYHKRYYRINKDKQKEYYSKMMKCEECGCEFVRSNKFNHLKSKKHRVACEKKVTITHFTYDDILKVLNKRCDEILSKIEK